jgi:TonB family protein
VQSSTVVRRTDAGSAELAAPAHGLSLTQRRFLTLLDTSCTVDQLAARHPAEARKFERDITRLAELGLVACDVPPPANEPIDTPMAAPVRLGNPGLVRRLPLVLLPLAAALAWAAWHQWAAPAAHSPAHGATADTVSATAQPQPDRPPANPEPIATRVLKSDPAERTRDAARESRAQPKVAERRPESAAKPADLPVEHRSPPPDDARADPPSGAPPVLPLQLAPLPDIAAPARPLPLPAAMLTPAVPASAASPPAAAPPIQLATAAPASGLLRPTPSPALVPIAREAPSFPREAIALGLADGNVRARLTIDAKGNVSSVDIVEASHRAFTRTVRETLLRWRFEPGTAGRTTSVDVAFKRD